MDSNEAKKGKEGTVGILDTNRSLLASLRAALPKV